ncbi:hypothetical protein RJ40_01430 [Methanofollis aquaemaris]|uniref:Uncharacterized protein n=1 Tax=Methanofollis aquaemaris TaxID=126734 RepID=A0A8A3S289_9EURY|nr:hypothetical protein [Methanofollis aquaemaris]QSZ66252.1 hypothetical protein RJ40_01430 [Methanofollis aquaemaris]
MTSSNHMAIQRLTRLLPASLLAGLLGGGLWIFLGTYVNAWCWDDIICFNHSIFDSISELQYIVLTILVLFLAGMLAVALQQGEVGSQAQAVFAGGVSGCMVFLINMVHSEILDLFSHGSTDPVGHLIFKASIIIIYTLPLLFLTLMVAVLAVLGALVLFSSQEKVNTPEENARASRLVLSSIILLILTFVALPPLVAHLMIGAGMIEVSSSVALIGTFISLEHTAPDTIVLTALEVPATSALADPPYSVYINGFHGVDVSNTSAAAASGLAITVEPANGLQAVEGSKATWKGAVFEDNSTPVSVTVIAHGTDGSDIELVVLDHNVQD